MQSDIHKKALRNLELNRIIESMTADGIEWHMLNSCDCMKTFCGAITEETFLPCEHLRKNQGKKFKNKINKIDVEFRAYWVSKLATTSSNRIDIELR